MSPIKKVNSNNKQPPKTISINKFVGLLTTNELLEQSYAHQGPLLVMDQSENQMVQN